MLKISSYIKKFTAVLLTIVMVFSLSSAVATARVSVDIEIVTDADSTGLVNVNDAINVSVRFKSILSPSGEPVTIQVSDGAEILISDESDILFEADGVPVPIDYMTLNANSDVVSFITGSPAPSPLDNWLTFVVLAPSDVGEFSISVKIGLPNTPDILDSNYAETTILVGAPFYLLASDDIIFGDMLFDVYGNVGYVNGSISDYTVAFAINHNASNYQAITGIEAPNADGSYLFNQLSFPSDAPEGIYKIEVVLLYEYTAVNTTQKTIEYLTSTPILTVNTTHTSVTENETFEIFGLTDYSGAYMIAGTVTNQNNMQQVYTLGPTSNISVDGEYTFGLFSFNDNHDEGFYIIDVILLDSNYNDIASSQTEILHIKTVPTPSNPRDGSNIALASYGTIMTASSSLNNNRLPVWTNNGIVETVANQSWLANSIGSEWLMADFGEVMEFDKISLYQNGYRIRNFTLEYSIDGNVWYTLESGSQISTDYYEYTHSERVIGQYVRLSSDNSSHTSTGISIFEFEVYNTECTTDFYYTGIVKYVNIDSGLELIDYEEEQYLEGETIFITAQSISSKLNSTYRVVSVLLNNQEAELINNNQVQVTVDGDFEVIFEHKRVYTVIDYPAKQINNKGVVSDVLLNPGGGFLLIPQFLLAGSTYTINAPSYPNYRVYGLLISNVPTRMVPDDNDQFHLTITGTSGVIAVSVLYQNLMYPETPPIPPTTTWSSLNGQDYFEMFGTEVYRNGRRLFSLENRNPELDFSDSFFFYFNPGFYSRNQYIEDVYIAANPSKSNIHGPFLYSVQTPVLNIPQNAPRKVLLIEIYTSYTILDDLLGLFGPKYLHVVNGSSTPLPGADNNRANDVFGIAGPRRLTSEDFFELRTRGDINKRGTNYIVFDIEAGKVIDFLSEINYYYCTWHGSSVWPEYVLY